MKIVHFGDIHVWKLPFAAYDPFYMKRYTGAVNLLLNRRRKFPRHLGEKVVESILAEEADLVVFSGDMTTAALKSEFSAASRLFAPIHEKWKDRFFVIPGNHDRYTARSIRKDWYARYFPYGKISGVRTMELDAQTVVVGYDASRDFLLRSNGLFTGRLADQLHQTLAALQDKRVILVGHYPVDYPAEVKIDKKHEMIHREMLKEIMEEFPPVLYLHGHKHIRWRIDNAINCGAAGMISSKPNRQAGYCNIQLDPDSLAIQSVEKCEVSKSGEVTKSIELGNF